MTNPPSPCAACAARAPVTTVHDAFVPGLPVDSTLGLRDVGSGVFACPTCGTRYRRQLDLAAEFHDHDAFHFEKLHTLKLWRCPQCGSTKAGADEARSVVDLTYMHCPACGNGGLCDSWERDHDWIAELELPVGNTQLPDAVTPLAPGEGFLESLQCARAQPVPEPPASATSAGPGFGCTRCQGEDAETAWQAGRSRHLHSLIDESHYGIAITACDCGQPFVKVFTERIDWVNGEDDQTWLLLPLRPAELAELRHCPVAELRERLHGLGQRRFVMHWFPTGGEVQTEWRDGGFWVGPHD